MKKVLSLALCGLMLTGVAGSLVTTTPAFADRGSGRTNEEIRWRISLTGPVLNGRIPNGNSDWRVRSARKELKIEASNVNLPDGTIVTFTHNGNVIGTQTLALGRAELELRSQDGFTPPTVNRGDTVAVWSGGVVIVSGTF